MKHYKHAATETLAGILADAPYDFVDRVFEQIEFYTKQFHKIRNRNAPQVAASIHALVDEMLERQRSRDPMASQIKCKRGCNACCHLLIGSWPQEAALLKVRIKADKIKLDLPRLAKQAEAKTIGEWQQLPYEDRACVLLDGNGECRAYEDRPNACRKYFVVTDPILCDTEKSPGSKVGRYVTAPVEIVESAALTVFKGDSFASELHKALKG